MTPRQLEERNEVLREEVAQLTAMLAEERRQRAAPDPIVAFELRNALTRIANLEAELAASHLAAQRLAVEAVRDERERVRELIRHELYGRFPCSFRDEFLAALDLGGSR